MTTTRRNFIVSSAGMCLLDLTSLSLMALPTLELTGDYCKDSDLIEFRLVDDIKKPERLGRPPWWGPELFDGWRCEKHSGYVVHLWRGEPLFKVLDIDYLKTPAA